MKTVAITEPKGMHSLDADVHSAFVALVELIRSENLTCCVGIAPPSLAILIYDFLDLRPPIAGISEDARPHEVLRTRELSLVTV